MSMFSKVLRAGEGKKVRRLAELVPLVNALEPEMEARSDEELQAMTAEFRERLDNGETLEDVLVEAFALVREAAWRVLGQRHFDAQLMGGMALHFGWIAEMKTGEGKTLVSTLPVYLNALAGNGVHVVTVNDYLATRDSEWMGRLHRFLGLTVGRVGPDITEPAEKREAYLADVTYGTNTELGFDYLRDNMARSKEAMVQRGHHFAIIDEVDSILIDEARTPLIISGPAAESAQLYYQFAGIVRTLRAEDDYEVDEEKRTVVPTEAGIEKVERQLGVANLYDAVAVNYVHHLTQALLAKELYKRDKDYLVAQGEVKIVDEFTGRTLDGRRWSDGLHQAVEAKERVKIKEENHTWATVTLQNYFRLYEKLAGMTGTAETEASEFANTYELPVVPIPPNRPLVRDDQPDLIYKSEDGKFAAVVEDIAERHDHRPAGAGRHGIGRRSPSTCRACSTSGASPTRCSTPSSTSGRPRSSPRPAARRRHRGHQHGRPRRRHHPRRQPRRPGRTGRPRPGASTSTTEEGAAELARLEKEFEAQCTSEGEEVRALGGLYVLGQRAPREPADRQPAAWSLGPPGRPGREPLLPVARGRPDAPVRHRGHELGDGPGPPRRHADRGEDGHQGHRAGAEHGRGSQRRVPQGRPQVRRRDERAAQGHLRPADADHRGRRPAGATPSSCSRRR